MKKTIVLGSRGSELALWQTNFVLKLLKEKNPELDFEIRVIKTQGDLILDKPLYQIGDKGLFTKELEKELIAGNIDIAVHSLKDLPTDLPNGLILGAVTKRTTPNDVLIGKEKGIRLQNLPDNSKIATGSLRRKAQLLNINAKFQIIDIRGNLNTRFNKFFNSDYHAMVVAGAGVERLNLQEHITEYIDTDLIIPAVGQGTIALEIKKNNNHIHSIIYNINDHKTYKEIMAERAFLREMGGGCKTPIACYAKIEGNNLEIIAGIGLPDGTEFKKQKLNFDISNFNSTEDFEKAGKLLANKFN